MMATSRGRGAHPTGRHGPFLLEAVHLMLPQAWWMGSDITQHMQPLSSRYGVSFQVINNMQSTSTVEIRGNSYGIEPAAGDLAARVEQDLTGHFSFGATQTVEAALPREMVSIIIGRGGEKIQRIHTESGCSIMIQQLNLYCGLVIFQGSVSSILKAQMLVERQLFSISRRQGLTGGVLIDVNVARQLPIQTATIPTNSSVLAQVPFLFQDIQTKSGAEVSSSQDPSSPGMTHVYLQGLAGQVKLAVELLMLSTEQRHNSPHLMGAYQSGQPGQARVTRTFTFPSYLTALVVGRKGFAVKQLQQQSGASIHIPKSQDKEESEDVEAVIVGDSYQVETCLRLLREKVEYLMAQGHSKAPPFLNETLSIDESRVGLLIGKRGATIRQLQHLSGAKVSLTGTGMSSADNSREQISPISCITSSTAELCLSPAARGTQSSPMPVAMSGSDLDSSGDEPRGLPDRSMCQGKQTIVMRGSKEQLEYAKMLIKRFTASKEEAEACLEEEIKQGFARQLVVSESKVGLVIGAEGSTFRTLERTYSVSLYLPPSDAQADTRVITISGFPDKLDQCCERIEEILSKSADSLPSGHVRKMLYVPSEDVGGVIGKNGSTVRQLQLETGTHLNVETETEVPANCLSTSFTLRSPTTSDPANSSMEDHTLCTMSPPGPSSMSTPSSASRSARSRGDERVKQQPQQQHVPGAYEPMPKRHEHRKKGEAQEKKQLSLKESSSEATSPVSAKDSASAPATPPRTMRKVKELVLVGPAKGVEQLERFIANLIEVRHLKLDGPDAGVSRSIFIDEAQVGIVIGKQGTRVQSLQAHTACEINVTQEEHVYVDAQGDRKVQRLIHLRGRTDEVVNMCENMLKETLANASAMSAQSRASEHQSDWSQHVLPRPTGQYPSQVMGGQIQMQQMGSMQMPMSSGYFLGMPGVTPSYSMPRYMGSPQPGP